MQVEDNIELNLDHTPIVLTPCEDIIQKPCSLGITKKRRNWESFGILEERQQLIVSLQTDFEVKQLDNDIQRRAWKNTPEIKKNKKQQLS